MCGIIGITSTEPIEIRNFMLSSLNYLTARGHGNDGRGIAYISTRNNKIVKYKHLNMKFLKNQIPKRVITNNIIGHVRLASVGSIKNQNCHPFISCDKNIALVGNGSTTSEKFTKELLSYHRFEGTTDTECILHYIEQNVDFNGNLEKIADTINELDEKNSFHHNLLIITKDGYFIVVKFSFFDLYEYEFDKGFIVSKEKLNNKFNTRYFSFENKHDWKEIKRGTIIIYKNGRKLFEKQYDKKYYGYYYGNYYGYNYWWSYNKRGSEYKSSKTIAKTSKYAFDVSKYPKENCTNCIYYQKKLTKKQIGLKSYAYYTTHYCNLKNKQLKDFYKCGSYENELMIDIDEQDESFDLSKYPDNNCTTCKFYELKTIETKYGTIEIHYCTYYNRKLRNFKVCTSYKKTNLKRYEHDEHNLKLLEKAIDGYYKTGKYEHEEVIKNIICDECPFKTRKHSSWWDFGYCTYNEIDIYYLPAESVIYCKYNKYLQEILEYEDETFEDEDKDKDEDEDFSKILLDEIDEDQDEDQDEDEDKHVENETKEQDKTENNKQTEPTQKIENIDQILQLIKQFRLNSDNEKIIKELKRAVCKTCPAVLDNFKCAKFLKPIDEIDIYDILIKCLKDKVKKLATVKTVQGNSCFNCLNYNIKTNQCFWKINKTNGVCKRYRFIVLALMDLWYYKSCETCAYNTDKRECVLEWMAKSSCPIYECYLDSDFHFEAISNRVNNYGLTYIIIIYLERKKELIDMKNELLRKAMSKGKILNDEL